MKPRFRKASALTEPTPPPIEQVDPAADSDRWQHREPYVVADGPHGREWLVHVPLLYFLQRAARTGEWCVIDRNTDEAVPGTVADTREGAANAFYQLRGRPGAGSFTPSANYIKPLSLVDAVAVDEATRHRQLSYLVESLRVIVRDLKTPAPHSNPGGTDIRTAALRDLLTEALAWIPTDKGGQS